MATRSDADRGADEDPDARTLKDLLLDALVYAPIGLTLDGQELTPELARRGRQHAAAARQIGEFAVKTGLQRVDGLLASRVNPDGDGQPGQPARAADAPAEPVADPAPEATGPDAEPVDEEGASDVPSSASLAIPDYDLLAASQVVRRLDGLDDDQLEAVRAYEAATRGRRTILHKIARLQG